MTTRCTVCRSPAAGAIDAMLSAGATVRSVASQFGMPYFATARHARNHAAKQAEPGTPAPQTPGPSAELVADPLDELVAALRIRALAGSDAAAREFRLALQAQAERENAAAPQRGYQDDPAWPRLLSTVLATLERFPRARWCVSRDLALAAGDTPDTGLLRLCESAPLEVPS